jgi:signal transduction histidine kinase
MLRTTHGRGASVTAGAGSRIALASALVVSLIAAAVAVTMVSDRGALAAQVQVVEIHNELEVTLRAELLLWREREAMNEYLLRPKPEILDEVRLLHAGFGGMVSQLSVGDPKERRSAARARHESESFFATFLANHNAGFADHKDQVLLALNKHEDAVLAQLNPLEPFYLRQELKAGARATRQGRRSMLSGLIAGGLAIVGGFGFAVYATRLVRRTARQNTDLRRLDRVKDDFIATVSHELRTPLTSINGYLDLVLEGEAGHVPPEQHEYLGVARRNAEKLLRVVSDLLFIAQLDASGDDFAKNRVDLSLLARDAVTAATPAAAEAGVELTVVTPDAAWLDGDANRLNQVLDNLISNARKFTPRGGRVGVTTSAADGIIRLEVKDNGAGISAQDQQHLFDRFFRTESAARQQIQGTGLGLPIVKAIVEAHGGTIEVQSQLGQGSRFVIAVPAVPAPTALPA